MKLIVHLCTECGASVEALLTPSELGTYLPPEHCPDCNLPALVEFNLKANKQRARVND